MQQDLRDRVDQGTWSHEDICTLFPAEDQERESGVVRHTCRPYL